jgi:hypothetical protein
MTEPEGIVALRHQIIRPLVEQTLVPVNKLVVVGSAVMQICGIKRAPDIDVVMPYGSLPKDHPEVSADESGWEFTLLPSEPGELPIHFKHPPDDDLYRESYENLLSKTEVIDTNGGPLHVLPLGSVLAWKKAVGRTKDMRDVDLIEAYWATQPRRP